MNTTAITNQEDDAELKARNTQAVENRHILSKYQMINLSNLKNIGGTDFALSQVNDFLNVNPKGITNGFVKIKEVLGEISIMETALTMTQRKNLYDPTHLACGACQCLGLDRIAFILDNMQKSTTKGDIG